jgi:DNA-binding transcriptional MerR regulator/methylmalonyl-CoA mutase cobalamin-binding subunit
MKAHHAIRIVAQKTGLSPHVIRIWEKRYGAVKPSRSDSKRRLYSEDEIERLRLLREATKSGHSIGDIAQLPDENLRKLIVASPISKIESNPAAKLLQRCIVSIQNLDSRQLELTLQEAEAHLGLQGMLQRIISPLTVQIGELWRNGTITAAHEHFASSVIRVFLSHAARQFAVSPAAPNLIVATPTGQLHELGALLAALAAANLGWNVTYLGASLPASEISAAARQINPRAIALSIVYPEDDHRLASELASLRAALPRETAILVGGRAAAAYGETLKKIGAIQNDHLDQFCANLDDLRKPHSLPG